MSATATLIPAKLAGNSRPYLALGLTFLLLGVGFASPFSLVPSPPPGIWEGQISSIWEGQISSETLNLYALTAFMGWAHFAYAWQGQWRGSSRMSASHRPFYWASVVLALVALIALRSVLGVAIFSLITWVYNIFHFIKTETFFARRDRRTSFYSPAIAFAWFTLVLFGVGPLSNTHLVFAGTVALAGLALLLGDWRALAANEMRLPLLTLFFFGETLVWSAYSPYMSPAFRVGVYVIHIAAASFFHYLGSYLFAQQGSETRKIHQPLAIFFVNILVVAAGCACVRTDALRPLRFFLAPEWFTLWVALHLVASDLFPMWKRRAQL